MLKIWSECRPTVEVLPVLILFKKLCSLFHCSALEIGGLLDSGLYIAMPARVRLAASGAGVLGLAVLPLLWVPLAPLAAGFVGAPSGCIPIAGSGRPQLCERSSGTHVVRD